MAQTIKKQAENRREQLLRTSNSSSSYSQSRSDMSQKSGVSQIPKLAVISESRVWFAIRNIFFNLRTLKSSEV